jgi:hypothetical protein
MKKLLPFLLLLPLCGCTEDTPTRPLIDPFAGTWEGVSEVTQPGPDDGPVSYEGRIILTFGDGHLVYGMSPLDPSTIITAESLGTYRFHGGVLTLSDVAPLNDLPPLCLVGDFEFRFSDGFLLLTQIENPGGWTTSRRITLERYP